MTKAGSPVDVLRATVGEPGWLRPDRIADTYSTYRWRKFMMRMLDNKRPHLRAHYAKYLCGKWNREMPMHLRLAELTVYFNYERVLPDYATRNAERRPVIRHSCQGPVQSAPANNIPQSEEESQENF
ncbi:MAG: hypothetical protein FJY37_17745 [Betaproteobacteria bacterium]|nr:hypothetical protein [Betaproteobacteria bacterium]